MTGRAPFLGQSPFDIPYQPFTLFPVGLHPLLINQLIDLRVAVTGIVAFGATHVILVELLVRIVDTRFRDTEADRKILTHNLGIPLNRAACRFVDGRCVLRSCRVARRPVTVEDVMALDRPLYLQSARRRSDRRIGCSFPAVQRVDGGDQQYCGVGARGTVSATPAPNPGPRSPRAEPWPVAMRGPAGRSAATAARWSPSSPLR